VTPTRGGQGGKSLVVALRITCHTTMGKTPMTKASAASVRRPATPRVELTHRDQQLWLFHKDVRVVLARTRVRGRDQIRDHEATRLQTCRVGSDAISRPTGQTKGERTEGMAEGSLCSSPGGRALTLAGETHPRLTAQNTSLQAVFRPRQPVDPQQLAQPVAGSKRASSPPWWVTEAFPWVWELDGIGDPGLAAQTGHLEDANCSWRGVGCARGAACRQVRCIRGGRAVAPSRAHPPSRVECASGLRWLVRR